MSQFPDQATGNVYTAANVPVFYTRTPASKRRRKHVDALLYARASESLCVSPLWLSGGIQGFFTRETGVRIPV